MNYSTILLKTKDVFLWIYKAIISKFNKPFDAIKTRFPAVEKYPALKYSIIPVVLSLFFLLRYVLKQIINVVAGLASSLVEETSNFAISERSIVFTLLFVVILLRVFFKVRNQKKEK